eukprot:Colp12_sorted_trinity150504_noHs@32657
MFGRGVYFADMFSKSFNYCGLGPQQPVGFLLLCEVAVGTMHEVAVAYNFVTPPAGCHSVKGLGQRGPDFSQGITFPNGVMVPGGPVTSLPTPSGEFRRTLAYNEYIVYDTSQVRMRYLIQIGTKPLAQ